LRVSVLYFSLISFVTFPFSLFPSLFVMSFISSFLCPSFLFVYLCPPHFMRRSTKPSHGAPSVCCFQPLNCTEVRPCHDKCIVCSIFTQSPGPIVRRSDNMSVIYKCQA
jgi:hypothetical protein